MKYKLLESLQNMRNLYVMLGKQCQRTNFNENRNLQDDILLHNLSKKIVIHTYVNVYVNTQKLTVSMLIKLLITLVSR